MHIGHYIHDGRDYEVGDSVIVLYRVKENITGFITKVNWFNYNRSSYQIHICSIKYDPKRVRGHRLLLTEKIIMATNEN